MHTLTVRTFRKVMQIAQGGGSISREYGEAALEFIKSHLTPGERGRAIEAIVNALARGGVELPEIAAIRRKALLQTSSTKKSPSPTWASRGTPIKTGVKITRGRTSFLRANSLQGLENIKPIEAGAAALFAGILGYAFTRQYWEKKNQALVSEAEVQKIKQAAQAEQDIAKRQELIGKAILAEQQVKYYQQELEELKRQAHAKIETLPPEQKVQIPGEILEEIAPKTPTWKQPWIWGVGTLAIIAGVTYFGGPSNGSKKAKSY